MSSACPQLPSVTQHNSHPELSADNFYDLVRPHLRCIFFAALSVLKNQADAEEVAQEAMLKAFRNLKQFRAESKFSTWIVQIAINEARMRLRRDKRGLYKSLHEPAGHENPRAPKEFADWRELPSEAFQRAQFRVSLQNAMRRLPAIYREVFRMRDVENMRVAEVAHALGISTANVRTRLFRARLLLRSELSPGYDSQWMTENRGSERKPWSGP